MKPGHMHVTEDCRAVSEVLQRIGDKWSILVVGRLGAGPMRFSELRKVIGGISQKMLTQTLRTLERDGLVYRTIYAEVPPRVEYKLTPLGQTLCAPIAAIRDWAEANINEVSAAQALYDQRNTQSA